MMPLPGLATLRALGIGLMFAGVTTITGSIVYYVKGKAAGRAEVQRVLDRAIADHNAAALAASEAYRRDEQAWRERTAAAEANLRQREAQHETDLASVRAAAAADLGKLRRALAARPASGGASATDSAASASDCAGTAGRLLEEGLRVQAELAAGAEREADTARALLEAWPREVTP